ncbi:MAG: hypothetical protein LKI34_02810 [Bifidobacterium tibiigranuli]|uniref:hypothetical protein n=1 Tax=Bifidobacterium tibiigranuli TaxID=2172043 RepID=UPI0026EA57B6|nr:hypothetical protein [Bifidobacterium tibiigranuli]MCI1673137.1 hypothetical protein [Bifidobacterium tibiigranuli]MCI1713618.1 hypothetical protein [Bifidobacterium tibiigranuli]
MADPTWMLNGVPIGGPGCTVTQGSDWLAAISPEFDDIITPGAHGSIDTGLPLRQTSRPYTLRIAANGPDAYHSSISTLARLCTMPSLTLSRTFNGTTQQAKVRCTSLAPDGDSVYESVMRITIAFRILGVWWRSPNAVQASLPLSGGALTPGTLGDAPIPDAIIRAPTGVTGITLTDHATGTGITWAGTRQSSTYLYLDPARLAAWQSTSSSAWTSANPSSVGIDYPAAGPLAITPDADGAYRCDLACTGGQASDALLLQFRQSWW